MANNRLQFIDESVLDGLERLDLRGNMLFSLPVSSGAYARLVYLNVGDNKDLVYFPGEWQFRKLAEVRVHWAYHCCQFREASRRRRSVIELIDVPYEAEDELTFVEGRAGSKLGVWVVLVAKLDRFR